MTVLRKIKKGQNGVQQQTAPEPTAAETASQPENTGGQAAAKKKDKKPVEKTTRNLQDFSNVKIEGAGIDLTTLMNDGFPQLKFENAKVVEKLFENITKEMDQKTQRITFDSFIELVNSFSTSDVDKKVTRFFNLIDEDGNGELSYDEILHLCQRQFQSMKDVEKRPSDDEFYDNLADFFAPLGPTGVEFSGPLWKPARIILNFSNFCFVLAVKNLH